MRCPLETYICLICKGNRLDVLGNLSPNLSLCKILQNWVAIASETEYRKATMIHALQRVFCAWKRISHQQQLPHSIFQNTMFFWIIKLQITAYADSWLIFWGGCNTWPKGVGFFLSSDLVASHLLLEESDIDLWKTINYCTQLHTFVTMSMAHDWRPCTWRVNADLEALMLLGRVFDMCEGMDSALWPMDTNRNHMETHGDSHTFQLWWLQALRLKTVLRAVSQYGLSTSLSFRFACCSCLTVLRHLQPAVQLLFVSQLAWQLAKQLDRERGCCQPPVFGGSVPLSDSQS